jgi:hypothetical protein
MVMTGLLMAYSFKFAKYGQMNSGIITTIWGFGSFFNLIAFYFWKREMVSKVQLSGMVMLMICIVLLAVEGG